MKHSIRLLKIEVAVARAEAQVKLISGMWQAD